MAACKSINQLLYDVRKSELYVSYRPQQDWESGLGGPVDGMLQEHIAARASAVVKAPKTTKPSWAQLTDLVCTGITVWNALYGNSLFNAEQIVHLSGTGGVSTTGLLLTQAAGAVTIITSSSDDMLKMSKEKYGADHTTDYNTTSN